MKINKFNDFVSSNINESAKNAFLEFLNESRLLFTEPFQDALYDFQMDKDYSVKKISSFLTYIIGKDIDKLVQNYIGVSDEPDKVTFLQDNRMQMNDKIKLTGTGCVSTDEIVKLFGFTTKSGIFGSKSADLTNIVWNTDAYNTDDDGKITVYYHTSPTVVNRNYEDNIKVINRWTLEKEIEHNKYVYFLLKNNEKPELRVILSGFSDYVVKGNYPFDYDYDHLETLTKNELKIGRFVNKIIELYFNMESSVNIDINDRTETLTKKDFTHADIEKFVNAYSADMMYNNSVFNNFKIVSGKEIKYWYNQKRYENGKGQLGNSCMRYSRCGSYFKIYTKNSDVCQLLILTNERNELIGRALLWTDVDGKKWMDRVYTNKDSLMLTFYKWATTNGYAKLHAGNWNITKKVKVKVKAKEYGEYPYLDTLTYYRPKKGLLYVSDDDINGRYYELNDTDGDYSDEY